MTLSFLFAGFGGQGILFAGKQLAKTAMYENKQVSWLPSYGPEMRGGSANCSVIISDEEIGSPLVNYPDILVALNRPSFDKFASKVKPGGTLLVDSTLVNVKCERTDINVVYVPATGLANDNNISGAANVIMLGQILKLTKLFDYDTFLKFLVGAIPETKKALIERNELALKLGFES